MVELNDGQSRLVLAPQNGAAIASYDALVAGSAPVPLLKPGDGTGTSGCQLLVPWSNRISGGGFEFEGRFHAIEPNVPAGSASSGHVTSFRLSAEICVPKRRGPAAMTIVRVATGFAFGWTTLRDNSAW